MNDEAEERGRIVEKLDGYAQDESRIGEELRGEEGDEQADS
jgi:hypothetical protein